MQFTLQTLMISFVVVWCSLALCGPWGIVLAAVLLGIAAYIRSSKSVLRAAMIVCVILFVLAGIGLLMPIQAGRVPDHRAACRNNLRQLVLALQQYHAVNGCFPPAHIPDGYGQPMHSWRVLILPYLERPDMYKAYNFNEPWNGPKNERLSAHISARMPTYVCPRNPKASAQGSTLTNYVAVVGPETIWPGATSVKITDIRKGMSNTVALIEVADSGIHWMEPRDLTVEEACRAIHVGQHTNDGTFWYYGWPSGTNVVFADGSVRFIPLGIPPEMLRELFNKDGQSTVDLDDLNRFAQYGEPSRLRWSRIVALAVLVVSYAVLLLRPRRGKVQEQDDRAGQGSGEGQDQRDDTDFRSGMGRE